MSVNKIWAIDGVFIKTPTTSKVSLTDLETSAQRSAAGILSRVRAREGVRKISFTYASMTGEEVSFIIKKLKSTSFKLKYLDPEYGIHEIEAYCSTKDTDLCRATKNGDNALWKNVSFNCIEK